MKPEMKKLIIANLPYLLFVYLFGKLGQAYRLAEGIDLSQKLLHFADGCAAAFESAAPSFHLFDLLIGVAGAAALRLMVYCKGKNAKKYRKGVEYVHLPDVTGTGQLGDYYLNRSGMVDMPEEWKAGIFLPRFGLHIANTEHGVFTDYGYLVKSGDEWQRVHEGQPVPEEYRVMGFPQPEVLREAVQTRQTAAPTAEAPAQPQVIPIILNSKNSADRMKEITDKLENGIMDLFESDRFQAYLDTMARFHNYSFNNTILIAMQGGQLVAGYNKWRDEFHRNVKKGEKGIKIFAPAPYKVKKEVPKLDEQGQPVKDKDGNTVTEQKEIKVPAFKIVSVFDVSQTEGEPLPSLGVEELTGDVER